MLERPNRVQPVASYKRGWQANHQPRQSLSVWVCAGEKLARIECFLFISWMLHKFTFIAENRLPLKAKGVFIQFPSSYKIRAIKRC